MKITVAPPAVSSRSDCEQLVDLLRHEHGGRLVEDDDAWRRGTAPSGSRRAACSPTPRSPTSASGSTLRPYRSPSSRSRAAPRGSSASFDPGSWPSTMFSQTARLSASRKCWNTMPMPARSRRAATGKSLSSPLTVTVPSSGRCAPYSVFISVDLPAPFSPTIAWIVPGRTVRFTPSFATTPGKRLTMSRSSIAGAAVATFDWSRSVDSSGDV